MIESSASIEADMLGNPTIILDTDDIVGKIDNEEEHGRRVTTVVVSLPQSFIYGVPIIWKSEEV